MAEGIARSRFPENWTVHSAGSMPGQLNHLAVRAMAEIQIDISSHRSKGIDEIPLSSADTIITLCAEEECPVIPGNVKRLSWELPDPATDTGRDVLDSFRRVRDKLVERVEELIRGGTIG